MTRQDVVTLLDKMVDTGVLLSYSDVYVDEDDYSIHVSFTTSPVVKLDYIDINIVSAGTQPAREWIANPL